MRQGIYFIRLCLKLTFTRLMQYFSKQTCWEYGSHRRPDVVSVVGSEMYPL